jgi:glycolate oxidase
MVESMEAEGDPFMEPRSSRTETYPPSMEARTWTEGSAPPEVLLFLGCVYSYQDPRAVSAIARVLEAAGVDYAVLGREEGCCGYVDHLAGAEKELWEMARSTMDRIGATGAPVLVTPCAGCYRTFTQLYPGMAGEWPGGLEVLHMVELLDRLMDDGRLRLREGGKVTMVAYHDPCDLGRHCGLYDAPRRALSALPGVVLEEFPEAREGAACCGGGGALRAFDAEKAMDIARDRLASLVEGMDLVASACPSCKANLKLAASRLAREEGGGRLRVMDVAEVVASRLEGGGR